jgi:hypothetical protein
MGRRLPNHKDRPGCMATACSCKQALKILHFDGGEWVADLLSSQRDRHTKTILAERNLSKSFRLDDRRSMRGSNPCLAKFDNLGLQRAREYLSGTTAKKLDLRQIKGRLQARSSQGERPRIIQMSCSVLIGLYSVQFGAGGSLVRSPLPIKTRKICGRISHNE